MNAFAALDIHLYWRYFIDKAVDGQSAAALNKIFFIYALIGVSTNFGSDPRTEGRPYTITATVNNKKAAACCAPSATGGFSVCPKPCRGTFVL